MSLKGIVRDGIGSISRRGFSDARRKERELGRSVTTSSSLLPDVEVDAGGGPGSWAGLPPELLWEVIGRVEQSETAWPGRQDLVACASVCRSWRRVCKDIVGAPEVSGKLTFPVSLKQPGPRNAAIQCYIKRNKAASTYLLFLGLNTENGKFLLAARKIRRPTHAEYVISMASNDISRNSVSYMGKLRSNFLGTKFAIYDSQPPHSGALTSSGRSSRRFYSRKVSPKVPSGSYGIAHISYELNMLGTRGPRRMRCTMHSIPVSALEPEGFVPSFHDPCQSLEDSFSSMSLTRPLDCLISDTKSMTSARFTGSTRFAGSSNCADSSRFADSMRFSEVSIDVLGKGGPLVLKNKAPRWHEQLQCWCLNFRGRVTVASVKNFQLIAASEEPANTSGTAAGTSQASSDHDKVILQFGKIGRDLFTMDYRYPLSAFQAFGICLSSFDTKLACE